MSKCTIIRTRKSFHGRQGLDYEAGISAASANAKALSVNRLSVPPRVRAQAHLHRDHESAIYVVRGTFVFWWGDRLEHQEVVRTGDLVHIPAGVPHVPFNPGPMASEAVVVRTDPNEQESVELLPELDELEHLPNRPGQDSWIVLGSPK